MYRENKRCTYLDGCVGVQMWLVARMSVEKKKQKKIRDLHADVARDVLRAMLHGYAGVDADGCRCRWVQMRMWCRCGCGADADVVWMRMGCGCCGCG